MSLYWSSCISQGTQPWNSMLHSQSSSAKRKSTFSTYKSLNSEVISRRSTQLQAQPQWSFISGSRLVPLRRQQDPRITHHHKIKGSTVSASFVADYDIATSAFTWGTVAVLPFYTLMVVAPNSQLTQRVMKSSMPYILLGILYAYLVYLSWSPSILQTLFASKYWLPELPGILKLFSSEMTMASAWIHYLVVDLFAARQIYHDGMRNKIGTWHSICLCLMCCPVGIISHETTKALLNRKQK